MRESDGVIARPRSGNLPDAAAPLPTKDGDAATSPTAAASDAGDAATAPEGGSTTTVPAGCNNGSVNPAWAGCYRTQAGAAQSLVPLPGAAVNPITLLCPADAIAIGIGIGFYGAQGDVLDHLGLICRPLALDSSLTGATVDIGPTFGGNGGNPARVQCPTGMGMSGYTITYSGGYVDRLTPQCNLPRNRLPHGADPGSGPAAPIGGSGGSGGGQTTLNKFCGPDGSRNEASRAACVSHAMDALFSAAKARDTFSGTVVVVDDGKNVLERSYGLMGSTYAYVNYNFLLAAMIVEKISGTTYESFLKTRFFRPLGMKDTGTHLPATDAMRAAVGYHDDGSGALSSFADDPICADHDLSLSFGSPLQGGSRRLRLRMGRRAQGWRYLPVAQRRALALGVHVADGSRPREGTLRRVPREPRSRSRSRAADVRGRGAGAGSAVIGAWNAGC